MMRDPRIQSPTEEKRGFHHPEWHPDPYLSPSSYVQERRPLHALRSSTPPALDRSGRVLDGYHQAISMERSDFTRPLYLGRGRGRGRGDQALSQSPPPVGRPLKWSDDIGEEYPYTARGPPPPREAIVDSGKKYDLPEYRHTYNEGNPSLKHFDGAGPSSSQPGQGKHLQDSDQHYFMPPPPRGVGGGINSGRNGGRFPSSSAGKVSVPHEEEEYRFLNNVQSKKLLPRGSYRDEDELLGNVNGPAFVSSHSKDFGSFPSGLSKDSSLTFREDGSRYSRRLDKYDGFEDQDQYSESFPSDFSRDPRLYLDDVKSYHYDPVSSARREPREHIYHEHSRREEGDTRYQSESYRQYPLNEQRAIKSRESLRPTLSTPVVDEVQYIGYSRKNPRESNSQAHHSPQRGPPSDYRNIKSNLQEEDCGGDYFVSGTNNFRMKLSSDGERTRSGGDYGFGREAGPLSHKERLKRSQMSESDPDMCKSNLIPRRRSKAEEMSIYESTDRMLKRRHPVDDEIIRHNSRSISSSDRQAQELSYIEEQWTNENPGCSFSSKRLRFNNLQDQKSGRAYEGRIASRLSGSEDWSSPREIPVRMQRHAVGDCNDRTMSIKGRLRPCPPEVYDSYNLDRRQDFFKSNKTWKRNIDNQYDLLTDDGYPLEDKEAPVRPDLPEDSDEFKQLVENLFLQYSKRLNENPSTRRRYREQGNAGSLLCVVCGRSSKEFMDTRSLTTHTYMSHKFGKRAHHLALNKAICVLMGWKCVPTLNGACVCEILPPTEASTLKEDLIIWPPIVIIHNSTILNSSSDGHQIMSIEHMESILRGLGFSGGKIKVRHGKPGKSIMVVKFLPTFSGLQEAEKLHKHYLENKHGREEFQKLKYKDNNIVGEEVGGLTDEKKMEHVLYGYMGIAEDLDKVDFDTKKKSVVKSKKGIQAIADAPLKTT